MLHLSFKSTQQEESVRHNTFLSYPVLLSLPLVFLTLFCAQLPVPALLLVHTS